MIRFFYTFLLLFLLAFFTYQNTFQSQFMLDDFAFIGNTFTEKFQSIPDYFTKGVNQHYAPIGYLLNVYLFKHLDKGYIFFHGLSLFLFYLNCVGVFLLAYLLSDDFKLSTLASVLFCVHPINAEILNHISLNIVFLMGLFLLASMIFYLLYLERKTAFFYIFSVLSFVLALFSQELALLFPLYLGSVLFYVKKFNLKETFKKCFMYFILSCGYFFLWIYFAGSESVFAKKVSLLNMNWSQYVATFTALVSWYLKNLILPSDIVFIRNLTPVASHIFVLNAVFWTAIGGSVWVLTRVWKKGLNSCALFWFMGGFLIAVPASFSHAYMGLVIEPYWFYFSSIGFFLLLAKLLLYFKKYLRGWIHLSLICFVCALFFVQTQAHNAVAKTEVGYSEYWLRNSPGNVIPLMLVGSAYVEQSGISIKKELIPEMVHLADIYVNTGEDKKAKTLIQRILKEHPKHSKEIELKATLAAIYHRDNQLDKSQAIINDLLAQGRNDEAFLQLGRAFEQIQERAMAIGFLERCLKNDPDSGDAMLLYGILLANEQRWDQALLWWKKGSEKYPADKRFQNSINSLKRILAQ